MALRDKSSFGGGNVAAPNLSSSISALNNVGTLINQEELMLQRQRENEQKQLNADRLYSIQAAQEQRSANIYDQTYVIPKQEAAQRDKQFLEQVQYAKDNQNLAPEQANSLNTAAINQKYVNLDSQFARNASGEIIDKAGYSSRMNALNESLYSDVGLPENGQYRIDDAKLNTVLSTGQMSYKDILERAKANFLSKGMPLQYAEELAAKVASETRYMPSADQTKAMQEQAKLLFTERNKLIGKTLGKGNGTNVSVSLNGGANGGTDKAMSSTTNNWQDVKDYLAYRTDIPSSKSLTTGTANFFTGEGQITQDGVRQLVAKANVYGVSPTAALQTIDEQINSGMLGFGPSVSESMMTENGELTKPMLTLMRAKQQGNQRTTTSRKAGAGDTAVTLANSNALIESSKALQDYQTQINAINMQASGTQRGTNTDGLQNVLGFNTNYQANNKASKSQSTTKSVDVTFKNLDKNPLAIAYQDKSSTALGDLYKADPKKYNSELLKLQKSNPDAYNKIKKAMDSYASGTFISNSSTVSPKPTSTRPKLSDYPKTRAGTIAFYTDKADYERKNDSSILFPTSRSQIDSVLNTATDTIVDENGNKTVVPRKRINMAEEQRRRQQIQSDRLQEESKALKNYSVTPSLKESLREQSAAITKDEKSGNTYFRNQDVSMLSDTDLARLIRSQSRADSINTLLTNWGFTESSPPTQEDYKRAKATVKYFMTTNK